MCHDDCHPSTEHPTASNSTQSGHARNTIPMTYYAEPEVRPLPRPLSRLCCDCWVATPLPRWGCLSLLRRLRRTRQTTCRPSHRRPLPSCCRRLVGGLHTHRCVFTHASTAVTLRRSLPPLTSAFTHASTAVTLRRPLPLLSIRQTCPPTPLRLSFGSRFSECPQR